MAIFKYVLAVLVLSYVMREAESAPRRFKQNNKKKAIKKLYNLAIDLKDARDKALIEMCVLPTTAIYKSVALTQKNLVGHLARMQRLLDSLYDALEGRKFANDVTQYKLQRLLKDISYYVVHTSLQLYKVDSFVRFPPAVKYDRKVLDQGIQRYLTCVSVPSDKTAKRILRYATYLESLDYALMNMHDDILFLKRY